MTLKIRIIRWLIAVLHDRYPFIMRDIVIPAGRHIHRNPPKKRFLQPVGQSHTARMAGGVDG